jgi:hypothetical protein
MTFAQSRQFVLNTLDDQRFREVQATIRRITEEYARLHPGDPDLVNVCPVTIDGKTVYVLSSSAVPF